MKKLGSIYLLTLITAACFGQEAFSVKGQLKYCYNSTIGPDNFTNVIVSIVDIEPHYDVGQEIQVNESGQFLFNNLRASTYRISTYLFQTSSVTINLESNIDDVTLCVDNDFRPVPLDSLADYIYRAKKDIQEDNLKLYQLSYGLVNHKNNKFYKRNERLKKKFHFEIEAVGCLMVLNRQSYIELQRYLAYNKVAEEYLDTKFQDAWRQALK